MDRARAFGWLPLLIPQLRFTVLWGSGTLAQQGSTTLSVRRQMYHYAGNGELYRLQR